MKEDNTDGNSKKTNMTKKEIKNFRQKRATSELTLHLWSIIDNFKSKEEPTVKSFTDKEIISVLSKMITGLSDK